MRSITARRPLAAALLALAAILGVVLALDLARAPRSSGATRAVPAGACRARALPTLAATDAYVATRIYGAELSGLEVKADLRQISTSGALLGAVANRDGFATTAAVTALVYSHTHIVRLRVTRGRRVLSDIGGPAIVAPVQGVLRLHGRRIGAFVMSVQDDLGLQKLIGRYTGASTAMFVGGSQVAGDLDASGARLVAGVPTDLGGTSYYPVEFDALAFPSGVLRVWVLVRGDRSPDATQSCAAIAAAEMAAVASRIADRFTPLAPSAVRAYADTAHFVTHAAIVVRSGSRTVAASVAHLPATLPQSGPLTIGRTGYIVSSFAPRTAAPPGIRVYVLYHGP